MFTARLRSDEVKMTKREIGSGKSNRSSLLNLKRVVTIQT